MSTREKLDYYEKILKLSVYIRDVSNAQGDGLEGFTKKGELLHKRRRSTSGSERLNLDWNLQKVDESIADLKDEIAKELFDDAMKAGYVTVNVINALLLGMAGVGKTSVKHILLGLQPPEVRSSTPLAETPVKIHVRDVSGVRVQAAKSGWKQVEGDDLQKIVFDTISTIASNLKDVPESRKRELQELVASIDTASSTQTSMPVKTTGQCSPTTSTASTSPTRRLSTPSSEQAQQVFQGAIANIMGLMVGGEVQTSGRDPRGCLGSNWIYFTDSGGQPHFHNLLPHFVQGISAALFVHRLSERLDTHPMVEYYDDGRLICAPHQSPLTTEDTLKCLVRSMQTRSVDGENPNLIFLGTFLDKLQEGSENIEEKNEKLLKLLSSEFRNQLVFYNEAKNELIFAIDAKNPGAQENKVAEMIRAVVESSPSRKIKVPIWWYVLEIILQKLTHLHGRKVLSKKECLEAAQQLNDNFHEPAVTAALEFFHKQHLFHYFPEILPDVVFCNPQVLLDKLTELVKDAYVMREAACNSTFTQSQMHATIVGKRRHVRDKGLVTLEFFEKFPQHYVDGLFTPPNLIKLFMSLLILTPFSTTLHDKVDFSSHATRYYMPSLLDMVPSCDLEKHRVLSAAAAPLLIHFPNGWPRCGVFCCLQVDLIQNRKWELVHKHGKPALVAQNCVMMSPPNCACDVTLIDSFSYLEVHINGDPSVCCRVCPLVRSEILLGIVASCRALRYDSNLVDFAFFCPHNDSSSTDHVSDGHTKDSADNEIPQRHAAMMIKEDCKLRCRVEYDCYSQLEERHLIWFLNQDIPSTEGSEYANDYSKTMVQCSDQIIESLSREPEELAVAFHRRGFIPQDIMDQMIQNQLSTTSRFKARKLYCAILNTVKYYPPRYQNFLDVLQENRLLYGDLLTVLEETLRQNKYRSKRVL